MGIAQEQIMMQNETISNEVRDADDKLIFETSEDLKVYPTFESMSLKEELLMGKFFRYKKNCRVLQSWIRKAVSNPTKGYCADNRIQRCHCAKSIWYG